MPLTNNFFLKFFSMSLISTSSGTPSYNVQSPTISGKYLSIPGYGIQWRNGSDLSGSSTAAFNYWQQQQQNAYELELWNLNNQYNSPYNQMQRFQMAGLNPNLIYKQSNASAGPAGSSEPIAAKPTNFKAQNTLSALDSAGRLLNSLNGVISQVQDTFDYAKYGVRNSQLRNSLLFHQIDKTQEEASALSRQNFIQRILAGEIPLDQKFQREIDDSEYSAKDIPLIARYLLGNTTSEKNLEKLEYIIDKVLPSQVENTRAGTSLRESEKAWNDNIRDFVGSVNTGIPWLDSLLKAIMRVVISK